jgi:hypothetical protein
MFESRGVQVVIVTNGCQTKQVDRKVKKRHEYRCAHPGVVLYLYAVCARAQGKEYEVCVENGVAAHA